MTPIITSQKLFDFGAILHRKWSARLESGDSMLAARPRCSAGLRNGVGVARFYCAASISGFVRFAANFLTVFAGALGGFRRSMAAGWSFGFDPPLF